MLARSLDCYCIAVEWKIFPFSSSILWAVVVRTSCMQSINQVIVYVMSRCLECDCYNMELCTRAFVVCWLKLNARERDLYQRCGLISCGSDMVCGMSLGVFAYLLEMFAWSIVYVFYFAYLMKIARTKQKYYWSPINGCYKQFFSSVLLFFTHPIVYISHTYCGLFYIK